MSVENSLVLCPDILIATTSGMPVRIMLLIPRPTEIVKKLIMFFEIITPAFLTGKIFPLNVFRQFCDRAAFLALNEGLYLTFNNAESHAARKSIIPLPSSKNT